MVAAILITHLAGVVDHSILTEAATINKTMEVMQELPRVGETKTTIGANLMTGMRKSRMTITRA